ncbi:hypothetical protein Tco_0880810 [Tanacetum coccineum]
MMTFTNLSDMFVPPDSSRSMNTTAPSVVLTTLSFQKASIDKVPVLQVQHSDLMFFGDGDTDGGSDDEGSAAANSVMPALANGDRGLEGIGSSIGTVGGSTGARCSSSSRPPHPSQHHHHRCHHQMTHYHNCLIRRQDGQQDPPQGPPYPLPDRS